MFMFYDILNNICKQNGYTITNLLKKLNISTSKSTAWKNGSTPNGEIIIKIADALNISADYLLGREQVPSSLSDLEKELIKYFRSLDNSGQTAVLRTAKNEYLIRGSNAQHSRIVESLKKQDCAEDSKVEQK